MKVYKSVLFLVLALLFFSCGKSSKDYEVVRYLCDFEGAYWDSLVNDQLNNDNLPAGTFTFSWYEEESGLAGEVTEPWSGYWEGVALSNFCSMAEDENGNFSDVYFGEPVPILYEDRSPAEEFFTLGVDIYVPEYNF